MINAQQVYAKYKTTSVYTAGPERLLIMLYDGLLKAMGTARVAIIGQNLTEAHTQLIKSQDIVVELHTSLNMDYEISHALASLYEYFTRKLVEANIAKSVEPLDEIEPRIRELRDAWVQAAATIRESEPERVNG